MGVLTLDVFSERVCMYPDLLSGDLSSSPPTESPTQYPSLMDSSMDDLEKFLDDNAINQEDDSYIYPAYVDIDPVNQSFRCVWCDRTLFSEDQLDMHLRGKEHTKRCANCDISAYGSEFHKDEVDAYVREYGHDLYARLKHWPQFIGETEQYWYCTSCGKNFQTQRAVNLHLSEVDHSGTKAIKVQKTDNEGGGYASLTESLDDQTRLEERPDTWPDCIVEDGQFWKCTACNKKFNSNAIVESHLVHATHMRRTASPALETVASSSGPPSRSSTPRVTDNVESVAREKKRRERLSQFIDFEAKRCSICCMQFASLRDTEDHIEDFFHLGNYLQFTIDHIA